MFVRLAIADPLPIYRQGLRSVLDDDAALALDLFDSRAPDELREWVLRDERRIVLITIESERDWDLLAEVSQLRPETILVAVLSELSVDNQVRAVTAGAVAAIGRAASPEEIRGVVTAAASDRSILPVEVIRALVAARRQGAGATDEPSDNELAWLRQLARGDTVVELARHVGYSERMMFRLLRDLYVKLGVRNRAEALLRARDRGWV
ncbi:helix-turn-helix transcriptional regulator [Asanoa siamensis]|uniref:Response regulatory domain-containing protein n=1 Tax=Asanoa siamensis TaxID=926357 RepID=A0ABQ4D4S7_9ACTN|nr:response regulator transcription factor [Asanoa siamensis]GIF78516.1 hypothetical protein Asi02nite_80340 [Asanoa siamensis]